MNKNKFKQTEIGKVPKDWEIQSFDKILIHIVDNRGKTAPVSEYGIPLIATNCIKEIGLYPIKENLRYVSKETYNNWFRGHPKPDDIIIVNKGTPGMVCLVPDPVDFCFAQDMVSVRPDKNKIYGKFLFAYMRSKIFKHQVDSLSVGTTIPHLKKTYFPMLKIPIPSSNEQKLIGDIYYNLSYKIELNQQMNKTLGSIGQTLFKHWFIDFEFPDEEEKPYKSNGGEMVYSEELNKEIPKNWEAKQLCEIAEFVRGFSYRGAEKRENNGSYVFITLNSVYEGGGFKREFCYLSSNRLKDRHYVEEGDIVIANTEQTKRGTLLGFPALVEFPNNYQKEVGCFSHHITKVIPKNEDMRYFLYHWLLKNQQKAVQYQTGSVIWGLDVNGWIKNEYLVLPNNNLLTIFNEFMNFIQKKFLINNKTSDILTSIRDAFLPKLMSGQIRVPVEGVS